MLYSRDWQDIENQLYFNKKKEVKKKRRVIHGNKIGERERKEGEQKLGPGGIWGTCLWLRPVAF